MSEHKFEIGDTVSLRPGIGNRNGASTGYTVVARRPFDGGEPWYRVKSELERHERVAPESDLK